MALTEGDRALTREYRALFLVTSILFSVESAYAICPTIDADCVIDADTYIVRTSCAEPAPGTGVLKNCFTSMVDLAGKWTPVLTAPVDPPTITTCPAGNCSTGWLWSVRHPTESDPVVIDIGPGIFEPFICPKPSSGDPNGHVVVRGAGREETILRPLSTASYPTVGRNGIHANGCEDLVVSDLHAEGGHAGVLWQNGGEGTWTRVDMVGTGAPGGPPSQNTAGWIDVLDAGAVSSTHFLYDCRSSASSQTSRSTFEMGYYSAGAETYFFGGSIRVGPSINPNSVTAGVLVNGPAEFSAFDTQIIAKRENKLGSTYGVYGQEFGMVAAKIFLHGGSVLARGFGPTTQGLFTTGTSKITKIDTAVDAQNY
jgi:hypothetical protein